MKVALCAIGRLENNYIREWVEHYKMLGFNHIFLYDNNYDGEEHFEDVISNYIDSGFVDVINYRNKQVCQIKAYDECYHNHSSEYDWIAFFDIDEFMILEKYNNINDFLNQNVFKDCDGIRVCWKQFTDSGLVRVINGNYNCMNRFTEIIPLHIGQALHCKTIFKTKNKIIKFNDAHGCYDKRLKLKNCVGDICNNTNFNIGNKTILKGAWLNHYRYKTIEEFIKTKLKRCYPDKTAESAINAGFNINTFFTTNKKTSEKIKIAREFGFNIMDEKIIISFTSWSKRLHCVPIVVEKMKNQTMKPNKIILNLSKEEFTNMNQDLPDSVTNLIDDVFEINWVDKNTKVWKKFLPILECYKNDVIIPIDDDINYPNNYIEIMYNEYLRWGKQCPIVSYPNLNKNNVYSHSGAFSLIKYDFFGEYLNDIYNNLIIKNDSIHWQSDTVYSYAIWLNGKRYKHTNKINAKSIFDSSEENKKNAYSNYGVGFKQLMDKQINLIEEYIKQKYNKTYDDLFKSDIIVNFTTWKKRECFVPKMIDTITKQTLKPTKIVCWLSSEEYQNKIPTVIENLLKEGKINEVNFVEGNTYAHKRWETFKKYNNCYNIMVDDDIYYDKNYIKELYETSLKNQGTHIVWTGYVEDFVKNKRINKSYELKSKKTCNLSGMSCLPPYTFPVESFQYQKLRDEFVKKCDDSWCKAFYIKNNIDTISIHDRNKVKWKDIEGSQTYGIWENENKKDNNGTQQIVINFSNSTIIANAIEEVKNVYPQFDFMSCCDDKLLNNIKICENNNNNNNRLTPLNQSQKKKYTHSYTNKGDFYSFTQ